MWALIIIPVVILLIPVILYNGLIAKRNQVRNIFATTDALLEKRFNLIPNLVATVKGYAEHERTLLSDITKARANRGWDKISDDEKIDMDNAFTKAVGGFNKHFACETVVLPDTAQKLFGRLGQKLQSLNIFRGQLIKLEDPEFERLFVVYGNDQVQARYILSTSLMQRIMQFKKKSQRPIYLSFLGSKVFVAVSYTKNLFEPKVFSTLLSFEPIRQYYEDLQLAVGIVENLNLNTRIWTKR